MPNSTQEFVDRETFSKRYTESLGESIPPLYKYYVAEIKNPEDTKQDVSFIISTGSVDRDRDTLNVGGWNLKNFKKNPVVLWSHDYELPPIGRAKNTKVEEEALVSTVKFVPKETYPFAGMIEEMVRGNFINATSVGFQPEEVVFNEKRGGFDFVKQELLEYSIVPVPSNPEALRQAKSVGINVQPMVQWAEKIVLIERENLKNAEAYETAWIRYLDTAVKNLDKCTVAINLDLMESNGTIFTPIEAKETPETPPEPETPETPETPEPKSEELENDPVYEFETMPECEVELEQDEKDIDLDGLIKECVGKSLTEALGSLDLESAVLSSLRKRQGRLD